MNRITLVLAFCALVSCNSPVKTEDDITILELEKEVCTLSDSSYFGLVLSMEVYNDGYVVSDYKTHCVKFLDKNLDVTNSIGSYGKGPGDLNGPIEVVALKDRLFVFEEMNQRVSVFDEDLRFSRHLNNAFGGSFSEKVGISEDGKSLYCSTKTGETPLQKVNLETLGKTFFGTYKNQIVGGRNPFEFYHFVLLKDWIVAIAQADPVIRVYDKVSLEMIHEVQYDTIPIIKRAVDFIADKRLQNPSPYTTYTLVQDVSQYKNHLYLLVVGREVGTSCNHIVEFIIDGSTFQYERIIALNDGKDKHWYSSFLVDEDCIIAFSSSTSCIQQFNKQ